MTGLKKKIIQCKRTCIYFDILICIFILLTHLFCINYRLVPSFLDEYGYWANASYLAGYDWSNIVENMNYYAYGYSLILALIMKVVQDPVLWMKTAIVINSLLLLGIYFLFNKLGVKLCGNNNSLVLKCIVSILLFAPQLTFSVATTWAELFCVLFFLLSSYFFSELIEKPSRIRGFLLGLCMAFSYFVHHRFLGMILSVFLIMILLFGIDRKKYTKSIITLVLFFACFFILFKWLDTSIVKFFWQSEESTVIAASQVNTHVGKVTMFFSLEGLKKIFLNLCGRLFSANTSFVLLFLPSIYIWIKDIIDKLKQKKYEVVIAKLFFVLVFGITLLISILFMFEPSRIDTVLYGRYIEPFIYPFIIYGIYYIITQGIKITEILICNIIYIILGLISYAFLASSNASLFFMTSVPALYKYFRIYFSNSLQDFIFGMILVTSILGGIILVCGNKKISKRGWIISLAVLLYIWWGQGYFAVTFRYSEKLPKYCLEVVEKLQNMQEDVWILSENKKLTVSNAGVFSVQFLLPNHTFNIINQTDYVNEYKLEGCILIDKESDTEISKIYLENDKILVNNEKFILLEAN